MFLKQLEVKRRSVIAATAFRKKCSGNKPRLLQMANIRRGAAPGARADGDCAARANGAIIESRKGSDTAIPVPRRKRRREIFWRVETNGAETPGFDLLFMAIGFGYFIWNTSLWTISCTIVRMPN